LDEARGALISGSRDISGRHVRLHDGAGKFEENHMSQGLDTIMARVDRLERQNRWLKGMLVLAALVPGVAVVVGMQQATPKVVEAESFVVKDTNGRTLAALGRHGEYHGLNLYDAKNRPAASFGLDRQGTSLGLNDERGRSVTLSATQTSAGMAVTYESHEIGVALGLTEHGPDLALRDRKGKMLFHRPE
jgi:hypothetical protein